VDRGILIGVAVMAMSSPSAALSRASVCQQVKADLRTIRMGTMMYQVEHAGRLPPSLRDLVASGVLDSAQRLSDPWGSPYVITQHDDDVEIATFGPDLVRGTSDDFSSAAGSSCPPLPDPAPHRGVVLALLLAAAAGLLAVLIWFATRKKGVPRTALN
jgi:type II secretory pathway pseudopilin PulG